MLGLAPACRRASAICAIADITSAECFLGLYNATRCNGVSCAPKVAALTRAPFLMRKVEAKTSPGKETTEEMVTYDNTQGKLFWLMLPQQDKENNWVCLKQNLSGHLQVGTQH